MDAIQVRDIQAAEYSALGSLMVDVYSQLQGFPSPEEQPEYYQMLANIGQLSEKKHTQVLVAIKDQEVLGGVVYFSDMSAYGSGGTATQVQNASGIRLLGVAPAARGLGVGKALTRECLARARQSGNQAVVLHTTKAMQVAWGMYQAMGFERSEDLDFMQGELPVFGFRLQLISAG